MQLGKKMMTIAVRIQAKRSIWDIPMIWAWIQVVRDEIQIRIWEIQRGWREYGRFSRAWMLNLILLKMMDTSRCPELLLIWICNQEEVIGYVLSVCIHVVLTENLFNRMGTHLKMALTIQEALKRV
jgi:hypothetical protein